MLDLEWTFYTPFFPACLKGWESSKQTKKGGVGKTSKQFLQEWLIPVQYLMHSWSIDDYPVDQAIFQIETGLSRFSAIYFHSKRVIPFVKLTKVSTIRIATTVGSNFYSFEPRAIARKVCLCLNMPVLFDRSSCEIYGTVSIKLWGGKNFSLELLYQSLLPLPRICTLNISPLV